MHIYHRALGVFGTTIRECGKTTPQGGDECWKR
jgi:hypothetical protein